MKIINVLNLYFQSSFYIVSRWNIFFSWCTLEHSPLNLTINPSTLRHVVLPGTGLRARTHARHVTARVACGYLSVCPHLYGADSLDLWTVCTG